MGIPQGSCLGPLLFLIYINDLPNISDSFETTLFADDCAIQFQNSNLISLIENCNLELLKVGNWAIANRLTINVSKTKAMLISNTHNTIPENQLILNDHILECVTDMKFLGIIIDDKLKYDLHIRNIRDKISKTIGVLYKLRRLNIPLSSLKTIYLSLIHPILLYCLPIFAKTYDSHLNPLFILQKRAIRIISGAEYLDHSDPLFYRNRILKIFDQYKLSLAVYVYQNPQILVDYQRNHLYNTRQRTELIAPFERLRTTQQSVIFNAIQIWNDIPEIIKNSVSINSFKFTYKKYLLDRYIG